MTLKQLIAKLAKFYPLKSQECWDFSGYQTGDKTDHEIKKILLALDFTEAVLPFALEFQPDLIITHHPFLFGKMKQVLLSDPLKSKLNDKINSILHCPIYSYHTNYDKALYGMNHLLLNAMNFKDIKPVSDSFLWTAKTEQPISYEELVDRFMKFSGFDYLMGLHNNSKLIQTIGFVAGSGSSEFMKAIELGVDCFITGDCPHHVRLDMNRYKMNYIEVPHEIEEKGFLIGMSQTLHKINSEFAIKKIEFEQPFKLIGVKHGHK